MNKNKTKSKYKYKYKYIYFNNIYRNNDYLNRLDDIDLIYDMI